MTSVCPSSASGLEWLREAIRPSAPSGARPSVIRITVSVGANVLECLEGTQRSRYALGEYGEASETGPSQNVRSPGLSLPLKKSNCARKWKLDEETAVRILGPLWTASLLGISIVVALVLGQKIAVKDSISFLTIFGGLMVATTAFAFSPFVDNPVGMSLPDVLRSLWRLLVGRRK